MICDVNLKAERIAYIHSLWKIHLSTNALKQQVEENPQKIALVAEDATDY